MNDRPRGPKFPNYVQVGGRVSKDPERPNNPSDAQIRFDIAHPRGTKTYFLEVTAFGELAEQALGLLGDVPLQLGDTVLIEGRLSSYSKPVEGKKGRFHVRYNCVVAERIELLRKAKRNLVAAAAEAAEADESSDTGFDDEL